VTETVKPPRSLGGIAKVVAAATLLSKFFGLFRQVAIAAVFGQGIVVEAYSYSYVIPGFFLILLGGINGPFHSAIVSVVSKQKKQEDIAPLIETINTFVFAVLFLFMLLLVFFAEPLVLLCARGLQNSPQTLEVAVAQFRIMAPMTVLAGLIGVGFGSLNAADQYWLPSVSPLFSSLTVILGMGWYVWHLGGVSPVMLQPENILLGGAVLAWSTLAGAVLQWLIQVPAQWKAGLGRPRFRFGFNRPEVREVIRLLGPATFSSGMMQINVFVDLYFASFIAKAAPALGNASLLVQTPLGIISNVILVPLFPIFSRLADPQNWDELKQRIRQGLMLTGLTMLPLSALMVALANPIVRVVYERLAFNVEDSKIVTYVLVAYAVGMFVYLARDILVRVFYALGDADTPFRISIFNIVLNGVMDWILSANYGTAGLVLSTVTVNTVSTIWLLISLDRKINGLPFRQWTTQLGGLFICSLIAGSAAWGIRLGVASSLGDRGFFPLVMQLAIAGLSGLTIFVILAMQLKLPEFEQLIRTVRGRFGRGRGD
jgi:putative peptidoglycan lipid II flippase